MDGEFAMVPAPQDIRPPLGYSADFDLQEAGDASKKAADKTDLIKKVGQPRHHREVPLSARQQCFTQAEGRLYAFVLFSFPGYQLTGCSQGF